MTHPTMASYERDPWTLTLDERFAAIRESERDIAHIQARQARVIAAIVDDPREESPAPKLEKEYVREELRVVLGESAVAVGNRIALARTLIHQLPRTMDGLENGTLTLRHARLLSDAIDGLADRHIARIEDRCVPFAAGRDVTAFARKVRREVLAVDDRSLEEQVREFLARVSQARRVWSRPDDYCAAMEHFGAVLPAHGAQALMMALDVAADRKKSDDPGDTRTKDQRRADALVQLGLDALNRFESCPGCRGKRIVVPNDNPGEVQGDYGTPEGSELPRYQGLRPAINVSVALSTLLGLDNQPGDLDGHGPIPAALARHLAEDPTGTWRRLVTDPLGKLIDYGRTVYQPPTALRDFVVARDRTCRFPTCHRPACRGELDHIQAWADGGLTNAPNLQGLCTRHHHFKHDTGWTVERRSDGSTVWSSPVGKQFTVDPATYPVDQTIVVSNDNADTAPPDEQAA